MKKILMAAAATVLASGMAFAQTSSGTIPGTGAPQTGVSPMSPTGNSNATSATQGMVPGSGAVPGSGNGPNQSSPAPRAQGTDVTGSGGAGGGNNSTGSGNGAGAGAGTSK